MKYAIVLVALTLTACVGDAVPPVVIQPSDKAPYECEVERPEPKLADQEADSEASARHADALKKELRTVKAEKRVCATYARRARGNE